jgi:hypothetical protein
MTRSMAIHRKARIQPGERHVQRDSSKSGVSLDMMSQLNNIVPCEGQAFTARDSWEAIEKWKKKVKRRISKPRVGPWSQRKSATHIHLPDGSQ